MNLRKRASETNLPSRPGASPEETPERNRPRDAKCMKYSWFLLPLLLGGLLVLALHPTWTFDPVSSWVILAEEDAEETLRIRWGGRWERGTRVFSVAEDRHPPYRHGCLHACTATVRFENRDQ